MPSGRIWRVQPALTASVGLLALVAQQRGFLQHFRCRPKEEKFLT